MRKLPIILLVVFLYCIPNFAAEVPFTLEKGYIIVAAKMKKDIPAEAVLSTGSPYSFLNTGVANRHKLKMSYTSDGPATSSNDKLIHFVEVADVSIGSEKPESLYMKHQSFEAISKKLGREIGMVLGADFLKGRVFTIDFARQVITFHESSPFDYAKLKSAPVKSLMISDMDQAYQTFYGGVVTLPVINDVTIEGTSIRSLIETGNPLPVTLSPSAIKEYSIGQPVPEKGTSRVAQLKSLNLNGQELPNVPVMLFGKNMGFDENTRQYGAVIGIAVLQNFKITFDWKAKKVVLER